jgi:hypothetical protein
MGLTPGLDAVERRKRLSGINPRFLGLAANKSSFYTN